MMRKQKIRVDKKQLVKAVVSFCAVMCAVTWICGFVFGNTISKERDYVTVTVRQGDSLWKIAEKHNKNGDVRRKVDDIVKFNQLKDSQVQLAQQIKVPID